MNLQDLYNQAKLHKDTHKSCGGEPYKTYENLFEIVKNYAEQTNSESVEVLELGTAIGFTAIVMRLASKKVSIDTIDTHTEHNKIAKAWTHKFGNINVMKADVFKILPYIETNKYDIIFYDVYGPKQKFIQDFERILKNGGLLISANSHLESAEPDFFKELGTSKSWEFLKEFEDTKVYRKCAIL